MGDVHILCTKVDGGLFSFFFDTFLQLIVAHILISANLLLCHFYIHSRHYNNTIDPINYILLQREVGHREYMAKASKDTYQ